MVEFESRVVVLSLRVVQAIFALIVLGTEAFVSNWWTSNHFIASPSSINFLIFTSVWTLLALAYLIIVPWRFSDTVAHHKFAVLAVEAVTDIFWFAGFIAVAVFLTGRACAGPVCESAEAGTVFAAFEWVLFAVTTAMAVMHVLRTRNRSTSDDKANPNMNVVEGT